MSETAPAVALAIPGPDDVRAFLEGLGTTADEVAASIREMGVKGARMSYRECPVAEAVKAKFPSVTYISVAGRRVYLDFGRMDVSPIVVDQTEGVVAFIDAFDGADRTYPQLDINAAPQETS